MGETETKDEERSSDFWKRFALWTAVALILAAVGLPAYCWYLSSQIEHRFAGRRWSIPSRVLSDTAILYPGQNINPSRLLVKLYRLGYREVSEKPTRKGELRTSGEVIDLFLHSHGVKSLFE